MAANDIMAANELLTPSVNANEMIAPNVNVNCQYSTRYCWEAEKVKSLIRLRAELSPLFTGKRNASKYAWAVVERELNVPLPLSKIIKKWNNLLQEYKAIKMSEEPKRREWPFFTLMDVYFSDQVNDPSLRLFSSTKTLRETIDDSVFEEDPIIASAIAAATSGAYMDIEELMRRQKERAAERKFNDFKYEMKPMLAPNNKFHNNNNNNNNSSNNNNNGKKSDIGLKLSKSVDDLSNLQQQHQQQQYKIKEELLRQHEQENLVKLNKQHARQQQQQQQQNHHHHHLQQQQQQQQHHQPQQQQPAQHRYQHHQHSPPMPHNAAQQAQAHRLQQPTPPPSLHAALHNHAHLLQQQHHHHTQQQQQQQQQQHHHHQHHQHQQRQQFHAPHLPQPSSTPTPPTTAQQIHLQTAQHQAAQQQFQQEQQRQQQQQQQQQHLQSQNSQFTDPNTIDQYLLSWNNFHGNMCRGFHTLQKDEKMVDVTIAAGGKIFKAHKLVLSVCSPYFQQIFLENPSSHPILLMADVEPSHMAGLLDFMYSGQVNVKYEDLPLFLKVAETMKIKGLHTEKNLDDGSKDSMSPTTHESDSTECRFDRGTHSVNISSQGYGGPPAMPPATHQQQPALDKALNGNGNSNNNTNTSTPIPVRTFSSFRDHIKSKATLAETFMKNLSRNNNNNSNNNFNHNGPEMVATNNNNNNNSNNNNDDTYTDVQLQSGNKKLYNATRKPHKYFAKRKILMHYNEELNEKRLKELETAGGGGDGQGSGTAGNDVDEADDAMNAGYENEHETGNANESRTSMMQQQSQHQQNSNNFKIRLSENPLNNTTNATNNCARSSSSSHNDDEEEALNLVQTSTAHEIYHKHKKGLGRSRIRSAEHDAAIAAERTDEQISEEIGKSTGIAAHNDEYDDNNNNKRTHHHDDEKDSNNNEKSISSSNLSNCKQDIVAASELLNAINKVGNVVETERIIKTEIADDDDDIDNDTDSVDRMVIDTDNNSDSNNNIHSQMDLSNPLTVKNIATAEILCGLKSKVFKMDDANQRAVSANAANEACRKLSEIKNAE